MRRSTLSILTQRASALVCAWLACAATHAAELGDLTVRSFIGQPLVADIELVALAPDELGSLQVRLASADVYRGANISMNPALQSLNMSIMRRDQRQFLHVTSLRPINAPYLHLFLELSGGGHSMVRAATLWLAPDPAPAFAPAPVPLPVPPVRAAANVREPVSLPLPMAMHERAGAAAAPPRRPVVVADKPRPAAPAACAQQAAQQCVALAQRNAELTRKLAELEGKIKLLQQELTPAKSPAAAPATAPRALTPLKPKAMVAPPAAKRDNAKVVMWLGGAAALLLAGLAFYLLRRRKRDPAAQAPPPRLGQLWQRLRARFARKAKTEQPASAPQEPVIG